MHYLKRNMLQHVCFCRILNDSIQGYWGQAGTRIHYPLFGFKKPENQYSNFVNFRIFWTLWCKITDVLMLGLFFWDNTSLLCTSFFFLLKTLYKNLLVAKHCFVLYFLTLEVTPFSWKCIYWLRIVSNLFKINGADKTEKFGDIST